MDTGCSLGEFLRRRREGLGYSINGVSRRLDEMGVGLSASQVRRIEAGAVPRADHLAALCHLYGVPAGYVHDLLLACGEASVRFHAEERSPAELLEEGMELAREGREDRARARFLAALAKITEEERPAEEAWAAHLRLAWLDCRQGYWDSLIFRCLEALASREASPRDRDVARCLLLRAFSRERWLEFAAGFVRAVEKVARDAERDPMLRAQAWAALARYHRVRGALDAAVDSARRAGRLYGRAGAKVERFQVAFEVADALLGAGRIADAVRELRGLERGTRAAGLKGPRLGVLWRLGRALVAAGRPEAAIPFLEEADSLAADLSREESRFRARAWLHRALAAVGSTGDLPSLGRWLRRRARRYHPDLPEAEEFLPGTAAATAPGEASRPAAPPGHPSPPGTGSGTPAHPTGGEA